MQILTFSTGNILHIREVSLLFATFEYVLKYKQNPIFYVFNMNLWIHANLTWIPFFSSCFCRSQLLHSRDDLVGAILRHCRAPPFTPMADPFTLLQVYCGNLDNHIDTGRPYCPVTKTSAIADWRTCLSRDLVWGTSDGGDCLQYHLGCYTFHHPVDCDGTGVWLYWK